MVNRYDAEVVEKAVTDMPEREISLTGMLNIVEKRCQIILKNGELDDLTKEILGL